MKQEQKILNTVATLLVGIFFIFMPLVAEAVTLSPTISSVSGCIPIEEKACEVGKVHTGEVLWVHGANLGGNTGDTTLLLNGKALKFNPIASPATDIYATVPSDFIGGGGNVVVQVGNLKSNIFPISVIGSGTNSGGQDCNPLIEECEDPATGGPSGNGGGTNNTGGSSSPGGLIGEGLGKISDRFDTGGKITGAKSVGELIGNIIDILLGLVLTIAILFLIIGGFFYITSAGDPDKAKKGKQTLTYAVLGIALVMLSYTIVYVINSALSQ